MIPPQPKVWNIQFSVCPKQTKLRLNISKKSNNPTDKICVFISLMETWDLCKILKRNCPASICYKGEIDRITYARFGKIYGSCPIYKNSNECNRDVSVSLT